jgi:hypothetical protein
VRERRNGLHRSPRDDVTFPPHSFLCLTHSPLRRPTASCRRWQLCRARVVHEDRTYFCSMHGRHQPRLRAPSGHPQSVPTPSPSGGDHYTVRPYSPILILCITYALLYIYYCRTTRFRVARHSDEMVSTPTRRRCPSPARYAGSEKMDCGWKGRRGRTREGSACR